MHTHHRRRREGKECKENVLESCTANHSIAEPLENELATVFVTAGRPLVSAGDGILFRVLHVLSLATAITS